MANDMEASVLAYIKEYIDEHGYPPTCREIAEGCSVSSTSVVVMLLDRLQDMGMIARARGKARGIQVLR